jgi:hypothetical protein
VPHPTDLPRAMDDYESECLRLLDAAIETLREQVKRLVEHRTKEAVDERQ